MSVKFLPVCILCAQSLYYCDVCTYVCAYTYMYIHIRMCVRTLEFYLRTFLSLPTPSSSSSPSLLPLPLLPFLPLLPSHSLVSEAWAKCHALPCDHLSGPLARGHLRGEARRANQCLTTQSWPCQSTSGRDLKGPRNVPTPADHHLLIRPAALWAWSSLSAPPPLREDRQCHCLQRSHNHHHHRPSREALHVSLQRSLVLLWIVHQQDRQRRLQ